MSGSMGGMDAATADREGGSDEASGLLAYLEKAPLAALALGISSGFPYAMIGATLTTRLAQNNITKSTITAFSLAFLVYNLKPLWAWVVDGVRLPVLGRLGQRVSWLIFAGLLVMAAVVNLALADPQADIAWVVARSEEHTSELQSLMRISYPVFCLKKKKIDI